MKNKIQYIILFITFFASSLTYTHNVDNQNLRHLVVSLNTDKLTFEQNEPIRVNFQLINTGSTMASFHLSKYDYYNFNFKIFSIQKQQIEERIERINKKNLNKSSIGIHKHLLLRPQEIYGQSFRLDQLFKLEKPGIYIIKGIFYAVPQNILKKLPQHNENQQMQIETPLIQIKIKPSQHDHSYSEQLSNLQKINIKKKKSMSPENIVKESIEARMNKQWNLFFEYFNLESLIRDFPQYGNRYKYEAEPHSSVHLALGSFREKREVMNEFKNYLKMYPNKLGIGKIKGFEITKTIIYNVENKAKVYTHILYSKEPISLIQQYIFLLEKKQNQWKIYSYQIENFS